MIKRTWVVEIEKVDRLASTTGLYGRGKRFLRRTSYCNRKKYIRWLLSDSYSKVFDLRPLSAVS